MTDWNASNLVSLFSIKKKKIAISFQEFAYLLYIQEVLLVLYNKFTRKPLLNIRFSVPLLSIFGFVFQYFFVYNCLCVYVSICLFFFIAQSLLWTVCFCFTLTLTFIFYPPGNFLTCNEPLRIADPDSYLGKGRIQICSEHPDPKFL